MFKVPSVFVYKNLLFASHFLSSNPVLIFAFSLSIKLQGSILIAKVDTNTRFLSFFLRYAMTVWYFDAEERAEAKKKFRNLTGMIILSVFTTKNLMDFAIS